MRKPLVHGEYLIWRRPKANAFKVVSLLANRCSSGEASHAPWGERTASALAGNDDVGDGPPLTQQHWNKTQDPQASLGDISQAWGWRAQHTGLTRSYDLEDATYGDDLPEEDPKSFAQLPLGLSLSINMDV